MGKYIDLKGSNITREAYPMINQAFEQVDSDIQSLVLGEVNLDGVNAQITTIQQEIATIQQVVQDLENCDVSNLEEINVTIDGINQDIISIEGNISNLQSNIANINTQLQADDETIGEILSDIGVIEQNITSLNNSMTELQADLLALTASVATIETRLSTTNENISSISQALTTAQGNISTLQTALASIQSNISILQSDVSTAKTNITNLQNGLSTAQGNITTLQTDVNGLKTDLQTQSYSTPVEVTSPIISLPTNTVQGQFRGSLYGNTNVAKNTLTQRIKSIGKNLFDVMTDNYITFQSNGLLIFPEFKVSERYNYILQDNQLIVNNYTETNYRWMGKRLVLEKNKNYVVSAYGATIVNFKIVGYNAVTSGSAGTLLRDGGGSFNTGNYEYYFICFYGKGTWKIQVERDTATIYEPYQESMIYLPNNIILRSLSNNTKDEIYLTQGNGNEYVKRVSSDIVLSGNSGWSSLHNDSINGLYRAQLTGWVSANNGLVNTSSHRVLSSIHQYASVSYVNGALSNKFQVAFHPDGNLYVSVDKGYLDTNYAGTLAGLQAYLNDYPITLNYQLATPIITKIDGLTPLQSFPKGTVYIEPFVKNTKAYTSTGIAISNTSLPIKAMERVTLIKNSIKTEIFLSKITIATDKLSFTIAGATTGEIYEYVYEYDSALTTVPTLNYSVPLNRSAQIEDNSKMINQVSKNLADYIAFNNAMMFNQEIRIAMLESN